MPNLESAMLHNIIIIIIIIIIIMYVAYAHTHQDAFLAAKPGGDDEESLFYKVSHFLKPCTCRPG